MTTKAKGLIVLSGGMDSVTLLYDFKESIALAVSFNYGSNHNEKEIHFAQWHCKQLNIPHIVLNMVEVFKHFESSLLQGSDAIPDGHYAEENMKSTVVPFRNGIMLSIAAGLAETKELTELYIANHFGDHAIYPDCRNSFVNAMSQAISEGTYEGIKVNAPYTNISKSDIARIGKKLNIDYSQTWSCYKGLEQQCGTCGTCVERIEAMHDAEIIDTTNYLNK